MKTEKIPNGSWQKLSVIISIASVVLAPLISVYASIHVIDARINALGQDIREVRETVIENQRDMKRHLQYHLEMHSKGK